MRFLSIIIISSPAIVHSKLVVLAMFIVVWSSASSTQSNEPVPTAENCDHAACTPITGLCTAMSFICVDLWFWSNRRDEESLNVRCSQIHLEPSSIVFITDVYLMFKPHLLSTRYCVQQQLKSSLVYVTCKDVGKIVIVCIQSGIQCCNNKKMADFAF